MPILQQRHRPFLGDFSVLGIEIPFEPKVQKGSHVDAGPGTVFSCALKFGFTKREIRLSSINLVRYAGAVIQKII
jgi:hypothetical protein